MSDDGHWLSLVPEPRSGPDGPASDEEPGPVLAEGSGPGPGPGPAEIRTGGTVVLAKIRTRHRLAAVMRVLAFLKAWVKRFTAKPNNKRGLVSMVRSRLHKMYAGQPGSLDSHWSHVTAAAWFPAELEGSWLKWVRFAWRVFGFTWCRFLKIVGNTIGSAGDHTRTAFALLVLVIILVIYFA